MATRLHCRFWLIVTTKEIRHTGRLYLLGARIDHSPLPRPSWLQVNKERKEMPVISEILPAVSTSMQLI